MSSLPPRVLLVDDEAEFAETLAERLEARGVKVVTAGNGVAALQAAQLFNPHVVVLDMNIPMLDGLEVLRRLRRDFPEIEVIILTGHGSQREEALVHDLGAFDYLSKPASLIVLTDALRSAYSKICVSDSPETKEEP